MKILFLSLSLLVALSTAAAAKEFIKNETPEFELFIEDCSDGRVEEVERKLKVNPNWVHESAKGGETCLHVAGIHGQSAVTKLMLENGADPDLLTRVVQDPEVEDGHIHMHALSWHIFGGHMESAKLLLSHGADPNQPMDSIMERGKTVTVLDLLEQLLDEEEPGTPEMEPFIEMRELLLEHGAKHHEEL